MGMEYSVKEKLAAMRVQQKQLQHWHNLSSKDSPAGTHSRYSRAADTIGQLVDTLNAILIDCTVAQDYAKRSGEYGENGMLPVDDLMNTLDHYLKEID
jgi:hypothetical protein